MEPVIIDPQQCLDTTIQFKLTNRELFDKAYKVTKDVEILSKMYLNQKLTSIILDLDPHIFIDVIYAIDRLKFMDMNGLIVNFTDLSIYAVFPYELYRKLLNRISDSIDDNHITKSDLHLYQVALVNQRQKLVFACTDPTNFSKLQRYVNEHFKTEVTRDGNQFTVNLYTDSDKDFESKYDSLYKYINNKNDKKCYESMRRVDVLAKRQDHYRQYDITTIPEGGSANLQDILKIVKTINDDDYRKFKLTINVNNVNNVNGNNININCNNRVVNQMQTKEQRLQTASTWITNNNPNVGELTTVYYDRYAAANINPIARCTFGPIVKEVLKRDCIHGTNARHW